jgi:hypothetical protein
MKPPRNIIRIDQEVSRTHAWRVTLQRKREIILKTFSDGIYGGKRKSLKAVVEYRNTLLAQDQRFEHALWIRTRLRKNNRSGIPGVGRYEVITNPDTGDRNIFWLASWTDEKGIYHQRKFYVSRYGERLAKRLAVAEREYQLNRACALKSVES